MSEAKGKSGGSRKGDEEIDKLNGFSRYFEEIVAKSRSMADGDDQTVTVGVRMTASMREKLTNISFRNQRTLSNQIRVFLQSCIDADVEE